MASAATESTVGKLIGKMKTYHSHHPIITGYALLCSVLSVVWSYKTYQLYKKDPYLMTVRKYRKNYIVIRPDDPAARMIKRGKIGLDY